MHECGVCSFGDWLTGQWHDYFTGQLPGYFPGQRRHKRSNRISKQRVFVAPSRHLTLKKPPRQVCTRTVHVEQVARLIVYISVSCVRWTWSHYWHKSISRTLTSNVTDVLIRSFDAIHSECIIYKWRVNGRPISLTCQLLTRQFTVINHTFTPKLTMFRRVISAHRISFATFMQLDSPV